MFQKICVKEELEWLENEDNNQRFSKDVLLSWIKEGSINENENYFCDQKILQDILQAKVN